MEDEEEEKKIMFFMLCSRFYARDHSNPTQNRIEIEVFSLTDVEVVITDEYRRYMNLLFSKMTGGSFYLTNFKLSKLFSELFSYI